MYNLEVNDPQFLPHCGCQIQLTLAAGEALFIIGENGLGKTTLVHRFYDEHHNHASLIEQKSLDLFYDRTLGKVKNIFLHSADHLVDSAFFLKCWEAFSLHLKEDRDQSSLSGGEGQALKLCFALARNVPLYFLDEPSQFLDVHSKAVLNRLLQELLGTGKSLVIVEHDLNWATFPATTHQLIIKENQLQKASTWNT